jgi:hypothetical protein
MTKDTQHSDLLDAHFKALRDAAPEVDDALMARVLADADAVQAAAAAQERTVPVTRSRGSAFVRLVSVFGGWPGLAGLATAGVAGVWIGVSTPTILMQTSEALLYGSNQGFMVDLDPVFALVSLEGDL